jgi:hypothetical protein
VLAPEFLAQFAVMKEQRHGFGLQRRGSTMSLDRTLEEQAPARVDALHRTYRALAAQAILGG